MIPSKFFLGLSSRPVFPTTQTKNTFPLKQPQHHMMHESDYYEEEEGVEEEENVLQYSQTEGSDSEGSSASQSSSDRAPRPLTYSLPLLGRPPGLPAGQKIKKRRIAVDEREQPATPTVPVQQEVEKRALVRKEESEKNNDDEINSRNGDLPIYEDVMGIKESSPEQPKQPDNERKEEEKKESESVGGEIGDPVVRATTSQQSTDRIVASTGKAAGAERRKKKEKEPVAVDRTLAEFVGKLFTAFQHQQQQTSVVATGDEKSKKIANKRKISYHDSETDSNQGNDDCNTDITSALQELNKIDFTSYPESGRKEKHLRRLSPAVVDKRASGSRPDKLFKNVSRQKEEKEVVECPLSDVSTESDRESFRKFGSNGKTGKGKASTSSSKANLDYKKTSSNKSEGVINNQYLTLTKSHQRLLENFGRQSGVQKRDPGNARRLALLRRSILNQSKRLLDLEL